MASRSTAVRTRKFKGLDASQRQAERRTRLVAAGLQTFGHQGFQVSTVKDVCQQARLTERYFYESFGNREDLFAAVYQHCVDQLRASLVAALASVPKDPHAMVQAALRTLYRELREDPRMARILFIDVLSAHGDMDKHSLNAMMGFSDLLESYLALLTPQLTKAEVNASLISTGLVGAVVLLVMRWAVTGFKESIDDMVRNTAVLFEAMAAHVERCCPPAAGAIPSR